MLRGDRVSKPVHEFETYLHSMELLRGEGWVGDAYPFNLSAVRGWDRLFFHPKVTYFVGENGSGKSTLIEAIAVALGFNAEGGSRNFNFATHASHSSLHNQLRLARSPRRRRDGYFLRAESFFNVATEIHRLDEEPDGPPIINSYGGRSLHAMSHGQSFMALLENRFGGDGLYILDEPEAALSPNRQMGFLARMHELIGQRSQFIIATHSPIILAYPDATIYELSDNGLSETAYEDLEHVQVTKNFLNRREIFLEALLGDD
ncbi:ABC transporter ATP-binding protein [alpha proteobacterium U9-1i]|nr:ABC transporter ATP-binding protein [alpha proteobacterium U9-1i]